MKLKLPDVRAAAKSAKRFVKSHGPLVGVISAGVGFTGSVIFTAKATVQAVRKIDYETEKKGAPLTTAETVEAVWRFYTPAGLLWGGSIISLILAARNYESAAKILATAYAMSESEQRKLEEAAREYLGPKKFEEMQYKAEDKMLQTIPMDGNMVYETGHGTHLCYDTWSGRFFRCCKDHIERSVNGFCKDMYGRQIGKSYNDLFYEISPVFSFGDREPECGKDVGWNYTKGGPDIRYTTHLKNGEPCLVMSFRNKPYPGYEVDW